MYIRRCIDEAGAEKLQLPGNSGLAATPHHLSFCLGNQFSSRQEYGISQLIQCKILMVHMHDALELQ